MACHRGRGSGQQTWVRHKPSWRRSPLTPPQSRRNLHRTGKEILGGHNRTLCTRTQEKGAVTPQETDPDLPGSVQESPGEAWVSGGRCRAGGTGCRCACMGPFGGSGRCPHCLHHSLASSNNREGTAPPINGKLDEKFTEHGPNHQNKTQFPPFSLCHQETSINFLSLPIRGQTK